MNSSLLKFIKSNTKFAGNEDLCDDFLAESIRRSLAVAENVDDVAFIEPYLKKVVNTSILTVLKNSGRVKRVNREYVSVEPVISLSELVDTQEGVKSILEILPDPQVEISEQVASRELLSQVCNAVMVASSEYPEKNYYQIFYKRYVDSMKQAQIAEDLGISQSEVCKRLYELVKIIKKSVIGY